MRRAGNWLQLARGIGWARVAGIICNCGIGRPFIRWLIIVARKSTRGMRNREQCGSSITRACPCKSIVPVRIRALDTNSTGWCGLICCCVPVIVITLLQLLALAVVAEHVAAVVFGPAADPCAGEPIVLGLRIIAIGMVLLLLFLPVVCTGAVLAVGCAAVCSPIFPLLVIVRAVIHDVIGPICSVALAIRMIKVAVSIVVLRLLVFLVSLLLSLVLLVLLVLIVLSASPPPALCHRL